MSDVQYQGLVPVRATIVPARAAYLVREGSRRGFRRAVQEASTRWGGVTEPILAISDDGHVTDWVRHVVSVSAVEGLVNVDLSEAEANATASELGLPWVPIDRIDDSGPVRLTCHPSWLEAPAYPTSWVIGGSSGELWQAVAGGELSDEHLELMHDQDLALSKPVNRDGIGRAQLRGHTWLDRTMVSLDEIYASPAPLSTPTVLWITTKDDLKDCWDFWNVRALGPRTFAKMPIFLLPYEDLPFWIDFDKQLLATLDRPNEFSTDVIITSASTPESELHELAKRLQLTRAENAEIKYSTRFPVTTERRKAPFTYTVHQGVTRFIGFDRRYGAIADADSHFFKGRATSVNFDSPVSFRVEGGTLVRLESTMFDGLPRRDPVASLIAPGATWRDNSIQIGDYGRSRFRLELTVPGLPDALQALLTEKVGSYALSDKGNLAAAFHQREEGVQALLEPNIYEAIRGLTTPRSKRLINELSQVIGTGELTEKIMDLARSWAVQGKRIYRNVSGIPGVPGAAAAVALERLCALGWAERGLEIKCTTCHTSSFLELGSVPSKEGAKCPACEGRQQYTMESGGPTVFYRLDGLVDHVSDQGVFPHLLTVAALTEQQTQSWFMPGVDLFFDAESRNEADVVGLYGGRLAVGEVKTSASEFTTSQLTKDVEVARKLDADFYVMAAPDNVNAETRAIAERLCIEAELGLMVLDREDLRPSAATSGN
ncbi:hypothetical protein GCM10023346_46230 [Arthrobacter gyeryongensis]|uniref:Uncharacterized protein n=1 Tax=Arthrobacter gyeryongensis TaxID=1650592 RepID=A0ABP9SSP1_9MICC